MTSCQVNGQNRSTSPMNPTISGTPGNDYITCLSVDAGTTGNLSGMTGAEVRGGPENDVLRTGFNGGTVAGDLGLDYCRTAGGNPPVTCEA
ncbi:hypothetical protein [Streptomyces sp. Da 82-17]|uniref:hypothetical protein n=1 Tax=Streptomyces sp. Da 82-17 TaxID=3377116 RepID=UPI0038D50EB1